MTTQNEPPYRRVDSDPWHNPAQPGSMRRLIEFTFLCPLCEGTHQPQFYFTMPTLDYDFFSEAMVNFMESPAALDTALKVARQIHLDEGNLADLTAQLGGKLVAIRILDHTILDESQYTCDYCTQTFDTIAEMRIHLGLDAHSAPDPDKVMPICRARIN